MRINSSQSKQTKKSSLQEQHPFKCAEKLLPVDICKVGTLVAALFSTCQSETKNFLQKPSFIPPSAKHLPSFAIPAMLQYAQNLTGPLRKHCRNWKLHWKTLENVNVKTVEHLKNMEKSSWNSIWIVDFQGTTRPRSCQRHKQAGPRDKHRPSVHDCMLCWSRWMLQSSKNFNSIELSGVLSFLYLLLLFCLFLFVALGPVRVLWAGHSPVCYAPETSANYHLETSKRTAQIHSEEIVFSVYKFSIWWQRNDLHYHLPHLCSPLNLSLGLRFTQA